MVVILCLSLIHIYYTNSYHVSVREEINVFDKFAFESEFQKKSTGGCISYAEIPNMTNNIPAVLTMIKYIYDNISYAEFNTKSDYCHECGFDGEIKVKDVYKRQVMSLFNNIENSLIIGVDSVNDYYDVSLKEYRLQQIEMCIRDSSYITRKSDCSSSCTCYGCQCYYRFNFRLFVYIS